MVACLYLKAVPPTFKFRHIPIPSVLWNHNLVPFLGILLCSASRHGVSVVQSALDLFILIAAPGHLRPLASLACKIVKERSDVSITFLCVTRFYKQLEREIGRYFSTSVEDSETKGNIRRVACLRQLYLSP